MNKTTTTYLLNFALVTLWIILPASAGERFVWPQFHGPDRDNISRETGLLDVWPEGGPERLWTAGGLGHGYASVAIAGGRILTSGNIAGKTVVTALDMGGKPLWQAENGKAWEGQYPGGRGTPTIDGGRVYHESPHGDVICLDAATGQQLWTRNILEEFKSENIRWALSESLLIDGGRVICCPGGPVAAVVALDKRDGHTVWQSPSAGDLAGYASPVLAEYQGLRMIITLTLKAMIGVNADTGALLWRVGHISGYDENIIRPLFHDGRVFVSTHTAGSVQWRVRVRGGKASVTEVWRSKAMDNQQHGVVLLDGYLYGASYTYNRGRYVCLDWTTGATRYTAPGVGMGPLTYADGMLYTLSEKGVMGLVRATPDAFEVISRFEIPEDGVGACWAYPVVCDGRLYIRHGEFLHAYDIRNGAGMATDGHGRARINTDEHGRARTNLVGGGAGRTAIHSSVF